MNTSPPENRCMLKFNTLIRKPLHLCLAVAGLHLGLLNSVNAVTTTNVTVGDYYFSPQTVAITVGDTVRWTWADSGFYSHTTTGPGVPALWSSPAAALNGTTFSYTFSSSGSFPYVCIYHGTFYGMVGTVNVQPATANLPPTVAITGPSGGANFSAPWAGTIHATASDPDDTVASVDFFAGANHLGTVINPASSLTFTVPNLAAGDYTITAVATDSRGATSTSAGVAIHVLSPAAITLNSIQRPSPSSAQFSFSTTPGLSYVVHRSADLLNFVPISTNTANASTMTFTDDSAIAPISFYSISLLPNP
jgi:plastocyanin